MLNSPLLPGEPLRIAALRGLEILDSKPEVCFDRITRLVAGLLNVPIALISLVDDDRQWFKAKTGLDASETPRNISFCGHAIASDLIFEIPDTHEDERFADNPLVTSAPNIRFYAGRPIRAPGGERVGTLCVIDHRARKLTGLQRSQLDDLANIAESELAVRAERNQVRKTSEIKSQFIAELSHELRTPTNVLLGSLQLLSDGDESTIRGDQALAMAINSSEHIALLLNDLVDLSQIETRNFEINQSRFELTDLLEKLSIFAQSECNRNGLAFQIQVQKGLPKILIGDVSRINQILMNILTNAVRYTEFGEIKLEISGQLMKDAKLFQLIVSVKDTGIGISAVEIENIFQPFFRGKRAKESVSEGSGLGLALSVQIANRMDGMISVKSDGSTGTTFSFSVPLPFVSYESKEKPLAAESNNTPSKKLLDASVMLVEDSSANRALFGAFLSDVSKLKLCEDGEAGLEFATNNHLDIIFMDISLPGMDGVKCAKRIRQLPLHSNTRIIAITAHALKGDRARFIGSGLDDYLPKPFTKAALISKLKEHLEHK